MGITNLKTKHYIRQLTADKIGKLVRISGQVVRTHPVHPELCLGNFVCDECGTTTPNVSQNFKYTQVRLLKQILNVFSQLNVPINSVKIVRVFF